MARAREADPASELASLDGALRNGPLARGYVLRGEERYFRERAIDALKRKAESQGYELCLYEAGDSDPDFQLAHLIDDLSGQGLFAPRRLIVVRGAADALRKSGGEESALTRAALAFVKSAEDAGTLVLSDAGLRADHALAKAIAATGGGVLALRKLWENPPPWKPDPRASELVQWTERRARELGLRLTIEQALYVAAATGNDLFALDDQLELLRASGGRELRSVVRWSAAGSPWAVADQMLAGDLPRGLVGIEGLFQGGFQEKSGRRLVDGTALSALLIGALQRGARQCLELSRAGKGEEPGGSAFQKAAAARARLRPTAAWQRLLEESADLERAAKSGSGVDAADFTRLALRWTLAGGARKR